FRRRGVFIRRSVPRLGHRQRDQLSPPRHRDARDVRPRPSTGTDPTAPEDPDCVHHRSCGRVRPSAYARARGRSVPHQAVQRGSPAGCGQGRASPAVSWAGDGDMSSPGEIRSRSRAPVISRDTPVIFVVDDDVSVRESLELLIRSADWQPQTFESAEEFLQHSRIDGPSCLVLDVTLPNLNGLDLQKRIDRADMPVIFITGYGDVPTTVQAMKAGAVEFLTKPFGGDVLLDAISHAIERSRTALAHEAELRALREGYASLTPRERETMALVVSGLLN